MIKQGLLKSSTTLKGLVSSKFFSVLQDATLDFDFENSRYFTPSSGYYSNFLGTTGLSFTRSNGTYFDRNGNIVIAEDNKPRLDHDPVTLEPLGLLVEEASTNLNTYSNATIGQWQIISCDVSEANVNALGFFDGVRVSSLGAVWHRFRIPDITVTSGITYTIKAYYQGGTSGQLRVVLRDVVGMNESQLDGNVGNVSVVFNAAGTVNILSQKLLSDGVTYELTFNYTPNFSGQPSIGFGPNSIVSGEDVVVLGCQIEEGDRTSSFIYTEGSEVTRTGDVASIDGISFPSIAQGTLYAESLTNETVSTSPYIVQLDTGNTGFRYLMRYSSSKAIQCFAIDNGDITYSVALGSSQASPEFTKQAFSFDENDINVSLEGSLLSNTGGTIPSDTDIMRIGSQRDGASNYLNGHIKRLSFVPRKYSNIELLTLTAGIDVPSVTKDLTVSAYWDDSAVDNSTLADSSEFSTAIVVDLDGTTDGIIYEAGGTGRGVVLYAYQGTLYFQVGSGASFGNASDRVELSWPIQDGRHLIECSASTVGGSQLYINGILVDSGELVDLLPSLSGTDAGGWKNVRSNCATNRGGWLTSGEGVYANYASPLIVYEGQSLL